MKRLAEIMQRIKEIQTEVRDGNLSAEDLKKLDAELDSLLKEKEELETREAKLKEKFERGNKINLPENKTEDEIEMRSTQLYRKAWLKSLQGSMLSEEEKRAITSGIGSGEAAIPTTTYSKIMEKVEQLSVLFPRVTKFFVKGVLSIPMEDSTSDAQWVAEGAGASDGTDKLKEVTFQAYDLIKNQDITAQMATMSIDDFEAWLVNAFARKMAQALDSAIINGEGSTSNQPNGIKNAISWVDNTNAVKITNGQAWTGDHVMEFVGLLPSVYTKDAVIVLNRKTLFNKINKIKKTSGSNEPLFIMNPEAGSIGKILGIDVIVFDAVSDDEVYYGDFSAFVYNFNKDIEISKDSSVGFKSAKIAYRAHALVDGKPIRPDAFVKLYEASV